jgi:hypothetical protein
MSIYSQFNGYADFKVIDDATGCEVKDFLWVDDFSLEYAVPDPSYNRIVFTGTSIIADVAEKITKVSRVSVNYAAKEIHLNEPKLVQIQLASPAASVSQEPRACEECCQESTCRRINYCAAWKCSFGEVAKP